MKILILEDEKYFLDKIIKIINESLNDVVIYSCLSISAFNDEHYDLALIDIQLGKEDGIEFVKKNESYFDNVIFVTSMENRVFDAFGKSVIGFISKTNMDVLLPVKLIECKKIYQKEELHIKTEDGIKRIYLKEIILIETEQRKLKIKTDRTEFVLKRQSIKTFSEKLDSRFVWVNQSTIINLDYVVTWKKEGIVLNGDIRVYASRKYLKSALNIFMKRNHV